MIPDHEVSALRQAETSFCYDDEAERAAALALSLSKTDCICWAETVWAGTEKRKAIQWDGFLVGQEVGYAVVDLEDCAIRAYAKGESGYRLVGRFRDAGAAKQSVMFEVVELPTALCEAFEAIRRFGRAFAFRASVQQFNAFHSSRERARSITR